jgi:hypothetical protein
VPTSPIYLKWARDVTGYELVPATPGRPNASALGALATTSAAGSWATTLDRIYFGTPMLVVPRGGQAISYEPLDRDGLYARFAGLRTPEDLLEFMNKFGPLTDAGASVAKGEDVANILNHSKAFRSILSIDDKELSKLAALAGENGKQISRMDFFIVEDRASGTLRLQFRPPDLLSALWLQLGQKISRNRPFRECRYCGSWFECGSGTGRRLDAIFCKDDHRVLFNSRKRSKGTTDHG